MRGQNDRARAMRVGRIQDKTRWTKALGEAVAVVYGDCNPGSAPSKHRRAGDRVRSGAHWS